MAHHYDAPQPDIVDEYFSGDRDRHQCAWESLNTLVETNPERAWPIIVRLIAAAPTDQELKNVGAAQLEDILAMWGARFRTLLLREVSRNPRMVRALSGAWLHRLPTDLLREVSQALRDRGIAVDDEEAFRRGGMSAERWAAIRRGDPPS